MNNTKDLIAKAKKSYDSKNFFEAKSYLLLALEDKEIDIVSQLKFYTLISDISYKINDFKNAEKYLQKYIEIDNQNPSIFNMLGNTYLRRRDFENSEKSYLKSIDLDKDYETALINLAILYDNLGEKKKAVSLYKEVLNKNKKNIGVLYNLSNLDQSTIDQKTIDILKKFVKEKTLNNFDIASCYFMLAKNEKKNQNFKNEINFLDKANEYSFKENLVKNKQANEYWFDIMPIVFNKINYAKKKANLIDTNLVHPIFIIGLPRCGSTLIESIISSGKNKVESLGETNLVNWAFLNTNRDYLKRQNIDKENKIIIDFEKTSKKLVDAITNLNVKSHEKCFFSEKSLENFLYIELILNIYPNARFINPYRNLIDNIFAIYKQFLSNVSWSHSLENILLYIDNYLLIIDFFKKKYSEKIFSISLEEFTANPKKSSMSIFEFCNLEWDEKCLDFYKRKDLFTNTASSNQIRSSVQKYDNEKYNSYKLLLQPYLRKYNWLDLNLRKI